MSPLKLFFGGSFDPIHLGHLRSAEQLLTQTKALDLTLLPNALSPLKARQHASAAQRKQLLELALINHPKLHIDWREVDRGGHSYTNETLQQLATEYPTNAIGFVMGLDSFNQLDRWHHWQNLCDHAHLLVIARPGYPLNISEALAQWLAPKHCQQLQQLNQQPTQQRAGKVYFCELEPMAISSTQIRQMLSKGASLAQLETKLSPAVAHYIVQHKLYGA
ncbi:nicotinate-nucleotide adenylyltransferase [Agarivorans sp. Z349TD_8]|uniref:nicotinate-nucleotide adenylyltransferase n=1 Tax=Agarivorans sp. Z349TD_8 TaxID=3421434 RepID=UPI003D7CBDEC